MSDFGDWHDPFAEDEAARERERRRSEREARRRGEQDSLAEKVAAERAGVEEIAGPAPPPETGLPAAEEGPPASAESPSPPTVDASPPPVAQPSSAPAASPAPALPPRRHETTPRELIVRRLVGLAFVIALVAILGIGASKVLDSIGGDQMASTENAAKSFPTEDVVIPEGLDRNQIAEVAKQAGLDGDYEAATKKPPRGFDLKQYGADDAADLEGFLFPATYNVRNNGKVEELVDDQLQAFEDNLAQVDLSGAESKNLSPYDVVIIASMIEREIQASDEERRLAAAVIYNRLKAGSPLGIDATIRFEDQDYSGQILQSRLDEPTPYNTRVNVGLPPGPIGNPGLASLEAAANPAKSDAFYFVIKPGTCNEHTFVETEAEFAEAEAAYQAALEEQGGSPTEC